MAKKTIRLEKIGATGARLYWEARINEAKVDYEYGQVGGAAQITHEIFTKGKNDGKANETSPAYQCLFEAERKARKKMENSYQLISGELETVGKTVKATNVTIPKPMLAKTYDDQGKNVAKWRKIYVQPKLDGCLSGDTIVELENNGAQLLKDVVKNKIQDKIKCYDIKTNKVTYNNILEYGEDILLHEDVKWFLITLENGTTIKATSNHPFFLKNKKAYRRCDELQVGDFLFIDK